MGSEQGEAKLHVVCIPFPVQGHITPMLKLAKLLHSKGFFHITFVNTEYNHRRLLRSRGANFIDGTPSFRFETIPDGLPPSDADATQDIPSLIHSVTNNCLQPFVELLRRLNDPCSGLPPIHLILSDVATHFTDEAARQLGNLPLILFWTCSACSFLGFAQFRTALDKGIVPFKDASYQTDGLLDMLVDWMPSMKGMRLKDLPSQIRIMDKDDFMFQFIISTVERSCKFPIIVHTLEALEHEVLHDDLSTMIAGPLYPIGPLQCHLNDVAESDERVRSLGSNLWREDIECLKWLDSKNSRSVVYVSFGSITPLTKEQLVEFAWGLAKCNHPFLWVIRFDVVSGDSSMIPSEFLDEVNDRGLLVSWCDQEKVLNHPSVRIFLTHCGWNSTIESISSGVPLICWPFFADQQTNCWYACNKWGIGVEITSGVKRDEVEKQIIEVMEGERGKEIKHKAMEWKRLAKEATSRPSGSSFLNLDKLINYICHPVTHQKNTST